MDKVLSDERFFARLTIGSAVLAMVLCVGTSLNAQTNSPCPPRHLFSCPVPRFDSVPKTIKPALTNTPVTAVELESKAGTEDAERYHWMNGRDLLTVSEHSEQGGVYGWIDRTILEPEVVHFKHVTITGSLVTAIKRKNPLCLLNPLVFSMDW